MARSVRLSRAALAWPAACALALAAALVAWWLPRDALDWQPDLAARQPWRAVTGALVHWSPRHLMMNAAGCALMALFGWRAGAGPAQVRAWMLAWPLTQLGLLAQPALLHYGGLSGVLHAAAAVLACHLLARRGDGRSRGIGALLAAGLVAKLAWEAPWAGATRAVPGWDFALAPGAHASGALAGLLGWLILGRARRRQGGQNRRPE